MRVAWTLAMTALLAFASCSKAESKPKPLSVPGEKVYTMKGVIVSRDTGDNTVRMDHRDIPGYMEAMTMDYSVRGADVTSLPANNIPVEAKLHVIDDGYWLTDVKKATP